MPEKRIFTLSNIDWLAVASLALIAGAGLVTMNSLSSENDIFFTRQIVWLGVSFLFFIIFSLIDWRFIKRTDFIVAIFIFCCLILIAVKIFGIDVHGSQSWFRFGGVSFQPSDLAKVVLVLVLAKYFSRRHIQIAYIKHLVISGIYALILFLLVFLQPDFGSAMVIFFIWLGMVWISGISKNHLLAVFGAGMLVFLSLWFFVFEDYQKQRIMTFINPMADIRGAGYNAMQSVIAVGSGGILGKGVGYGTQSRLNFLPEYKTDFVFAAFAEEWGFVGVLSLLFLYFFVIFRIVRISMMGATNFETLFGLGVAIYFLCHITINIGMNLGILPIAGITLPFMSYGGSHLLAEFVSLGILMGMRRYSRPVRKEIAANEMVGIGNRF